MSNFLSECQWTFKSLCATKLLFEAIAERFEDKLKPPTQAIIFKHAVEYLTDLKSARLKEFENESAARSE